MANLLFIVSREEPKLHAYLRDHFADVPAVEVILDRRQGAPAGAGRPDGPDRRQKQIDDDLRKRGWVVVNRAERSRVAGDIARL